MVWCGESDTLNLEREMLHDLEMARSTFLQNHRCVTGPVNARRAGVRLRNVHLRNPIFATLCIFVHFCICMNAKHEIGGLIFAFIKPFWNKDIVCKKITLPFVFGHIFDICVYSELYIT